MSKSEQKQAEGKIRYVHAESLTIVRTGRAQRFIYKNAAGKPLKDKSILKRISSLVIPPAWREVKICQFSLGHIQAIGKDARGRKQYKYHPLFRANRESHKYERLLKFGRILPLIRKRVMTDLASPRLSRDKVLALVTRLLEITLIRVGSIEYAKLNKSYGLTTMLDRHVDIHGNHIQFHFKGKSNIRHTIDVKDRRLARLVKECQDLPGQELFQFTDDDGVVHDISSSDINEYLHRIAGDEFTAKDFRTWAGTVLAAEALRQFRKFDSQAQAKRYVTKAIEAVAKRLGNTPTICRKCYVHPSIVNSYLDGQLVDQLKIQTEQALKKPLKGLNAEEAAVLVFLQQTLSKRN